MSEGFREVIDMGTDIVLEREVVSREGLNTSTSVQLPNSSREPRSTSLWVTSSRRAFVVTYLVMLGVGIFSGDSTDDIPEVTPHEISLTAQDLSVVETVSGQVVTWTDPAQVLPARTN